MENLQPFWETWALLSPLTVFFFLRFKQDFFCFNLCPLSLDFPIINPCWLLLTTFFFCPCLEMTSSRKIFSITFPGTEVRLMGLLFSGSFFISTVSLKCLSQCQWWQLVWSLVINWGAKEHCSTFPSSMRTSWCHMHLRSQIWREKVFIQLSLCISKVVERCLFLTDTFQPELKENPSLQDRACGQTVSLTWSYKMKCCTLGSSTNNNTIKGNAYALKNGRQQIPHY